MELLLCVSQQTTDHPYRFQATGIQVYTFEEVLYHAYHHWKQSVDDIIGPNLAAWVQDALGLSLLSAKIKEIARIESFSERMLAFLGIIEYFDGQELEAITPHLKRWEKRLEWETYKERADDLVHRGEPDKAIALYRRALLYDENIPVLNNLSIAYMQIEAYDEACRYLERALELDEKLGEKLGEKNNQNLLLHYGEALIAAMRLDEAKRVIKQINSSTSTNPDILFLQGELAFAQGQIAEAISYFEKAIAISPEDEYIYRLSDVYAKRRQFEKALEILDNKTKYFYDKEQNQKQNQEQNQKPDQQNQKPNQQNQHLLMKKAELFYLADNLPSAISTVKKAIEINASHVELWVHLARYHRLDYDLPKAEEAITKALSLDTSNERARLENARIQKNLGHVKAYQQLLKEILAEIKQQYRGSYS